MKSRLIGLLVITVLATALTACGNREHTISVDMSSQKVEKDNNTVKKEIADSMWMQSKVTDKIIEDEDRHDDGIIVTSANTEVGEIEIENNDSSIEWTIENGTDISYNGRIYHDLYKSATSIDLPVDTNTFINFILKTYQTDETEIFTEFRIDSETEDDIISVKEVASELRGYQEAYNKYEEDVEWEFEIAERGFNNQALLYGCSKYMLYKGSVDSISVDMSYYDSGVVNDILNSDVNTSVEADDTDMNSVNDIEEINEAEDTENEQE